MAVSCPISNEPTKYFPIQVHLWHLFGICYGRIFNSWYILIDWEVVLLPILSAKPDHLFWNDSTDMNEILYPLRYWCGRYRCMFLCFLIGAFVPYDFHMAWDLLHQHLFLFLSQLFTPSLNFINAAWLELFGTDPASFAILRLSMQMWIPDASPAIGLERAASRPSYSPRISTSYSSTLALREKAFVPNHCFFYSLIQADPIPTIFSVLSNFCDLSVWKTISSGLYKCLAIGWSCALFSFDLCSPCCRYGFYDVPQ